MTKLKDIMFQRQSSIQPCGTAVKENMCYVKLAKSERKQSPQTLLPCSTWYCSIRTRVVSRLWFIYAPFEPAAQSAYATLGCRGGDIRFVSTVGQESLRRPALSGDLLYMTPWAFSTSPSGFGSSSRGPFYEPLASRSCIIGSRIPGTVS